MMDVKDKSIRKEIKRESILEAAANLFSNHNYHEVMMEDVAKKVSIAKGTLYLYFTSKEELYYSVIQSRLEKLVQSLEGKISQNENVVGSLKVLVVHTYMFMMKYQNFFLMYEKEKLKANNEVCSLIHQLEEKRLRLLTDVIKKGKEELTFRTIDDTLAAEMIQNSIYAAIKMGIGKRMSQSEIILERENIFAFVLNGLLNDSNSNAQKKLAGENILLTQSSGTNEDSSALLSKHGANVILFPTIAISELDDYSEFDEIVTTVDIFDYIIFTSANSVNYYAQRLKAIDKNISLERCTVVAVGNKTAAACKDSSIKVDIIPKAFSAQGIIAELSKTQLGGKKILIPRSAIGRDELPKELSKLYAKVYAVPVYQVSLPDKKSFVKLLERISDEHVDWFVFTSPSTYLNFLNIIEVNNPIDYFKKSNIAVIGPTTKSAVEKTGVRVSVMPQVFNMHSLINEIVNYK